MIRGLYTAATAMITQEAKQDVITNNLANVNTVGFKGDNLAVKQFDDVLLSNYDKVVGGKAVKQELGTISFGSKIDDVATNFTQGMIEKTEKNTDFAIEGKGFFVVSRNDGIATNRFYTRDGHFHINVNGYLVNDSGDNVLGKNLQNGNIEPIKVDSTNISSDAFGNISVDNVSKYKLQLVDFRDDNNNVDAYKSLQKVGNNLYTTKDNDRYIKENENITVRNEALEKSNINVIKEMTNMITVMRTFETNQKIIQTMDETLGKAVNEVGSVR